MDIEKTMQFLIESAGQHEARIAAAERNIVVLGDALISLTSVVKAMADNMDDMRKEMRERDAKTDERIGKLVSAIGAMVNRRTDHPPTQN